MLLEGASRRCARIGVMAVVGATMAFAGIATGVIGIPPAGAASPASGATAATSPASDPNPYLPSHDHSYRHGAIPTRGQQVKIKNWNAQHPEAGLAATGPNTMYWNGGINGNKGVVSAVPKVYLVFWGTQWGTQGTDGSGDITLSKDYGAAAPYLQQMFKGLGTGSELWSGTMTQYCDGSSVTIGGSTCPSGAPHVGYPSGGVLAGVWYDNSGAEPSAATPNQLASEAANAATHFGNTTAASNRYVQYDVLSPPGTNPDNYFGHYCAWHDYAIWGSIDLAFTNMPYVLDMGASCGEDFVNSSGTLDGFSIVNGHEYAETVTDEFPNTGWVTKNGSEVGDVCAWISPGTTPGGAGDVSMSTGSFAMQSTWSNDDNQCDISHPVVTGSTNTVTVTNPGNQTSNVGTAVSLQMSGLDSGGLALSYGASGLPAGLGISSAGLITGTPTTAGTSSVTVTASDSTGAQGSTTFSWTVNGNTVTVNNPGSQTGHTGTAVSLQMSGVDSGGLALSYGASGLPAGLGISSAGLITGTPTTAGTSSVTVTASDSTGAQGSATFSWAITNTVTVTSPGNESSNAGTPVSVQLSGSDSGGLSLTYSASGLPPGLKISGSGLISGTPTTGGSSNVTVTATDSTGAHGSTTFSWTVIGNTVTVNNPGSQSGTVGTTITPLHISATDSGGATLTYSASNLPTGLSISSAGTITGVPMIAGSYSVTVTAVDTTKASGSTTFTWTIRSRHHH